MQGRGFDVRLVSPNGRPLPDVDTVIIPASGGLDYFMSAAEAAAVAGEFNPALIHSHYASAFGFWSLRVKAPCSLVSVWGSDVVDFPSNWLKRKYVGRVLEKANHVIATSRFLADTVQTKWSLSADRTSVIPFGVDILHGPPTVPVDGPLRLCYIKSHKRLYGPDVLLRALVIVRETIPDVRLVFAGEGPSTGEIKELASQLGLNDLIEFPGLLDQTGVYRLLTECHIMVMPSRRDAFGVAALEASLHGRPVIATTVGGVPEVVVDGETGLLVPPDDVEALAGAIMKLANDSDLRRKMGVAGRLFVERNYTWERSLDQMSALYERIIDENT